LLATVILQKKVYVQLGLAVFCAGFWWRDYNITVPSMGDIVVEMTNGEEVGTRFG